MKRFISYFGFWLISLTWGSIMTLIGLVVALILLITGHRPYRIGPAIYFKVGHGWGGVELGAFFVVSKNSSRHTIIHEAGHGVQNCMWGPLMPFVICIPSASRYWYREIIRRKNIKKYWDLPDYDSIWFEADANKKGEKHYGKLW